MIYFIENRRASAIKIGKADDPWDRLRQLKTGSPDPLGLVGILPGHLAEEAEWHRDWKPFRLEGEWFESNPKLIEHIKAAILDRGRHPVAGKEAGLGRLASYEPKLMSLMREAAACHVGRAEDFCANAVWFGYAGHQGVKPRLVNLVGWQRSGHPVLAGPTAYEVAYDAIYEAMPDCGDGCACQRVFAAALGA